MKKDDLFLAKPFFEKRFEEKRFVNVSVCKSNIKSKKNTFFARVCKTGHVGSEELLNRLKDAAPYIDINMMRAGMEKMVDIIVELTSSGKDVDFFNLGSFSLASEGAIEINPSMQSLVEDGESEIENANFDISTAVRKEPKFSLKFDPSPACKKTYLACKMALAIKKRRAPLIEKIEDAMPKAMASPVEVIKVRGENLKISGEKEGIGVYIKEENGKEVKIKNENIIENNPKMLIILLEKKLKQKSSYTLSIRTQYAPMGSTCTTSLMREGCKEFVWQKEGAKKEGRKEEIKVYNKKEAHYKSKIIAKSDMIYKKGKFSKLTLLKLSS